MAEIVNLRLARKRKARAAKEKAADEKRIHFGISKAERRAKDAHRDRETKLHEAHRRDLSEPDSKT